jgi:hypothetical protein
MNLNMKKISTVVYGLLLVALILAPFFGAYPVFVMKLMCFALFAAAFNLLLGFTGLLSFGHAAFLGGSAYVAGHAMKVWGLTPELGLIAGTLAGAFLGWIFGIAGHPPAGHLLRDDHAGARADDVLRRAAGQVHRRRRRLAGRAARQAVRAHRPVERPHDVLRGAGRGGAGLPADRAHHPLAVRAGVEGHQGERAARAVAGLRREPLQAAGLRDFGGAVGPGRFAQDAGAGLCHACPTCTGPLRARSS